MRDFHNLFLNPVIKNKPTSLPLQGAITPAHVRPTTVKKTKPAAIELAKKKKYLNSDLVKKFFR